MEKKPSAKAAAKKKTAAKKKSTKAKAPQKEMHLEATAAAPARQCAIASCKRTYRAKGYCATHYRQWRQGAYGLARYKTCKDMGCLKPQTMNRHGYCEDHFQNYYVKGMEVAKVAPEAKPAPKKEEKTAAAS
jgi:hypothetical protein